MESAGHHIRDCCKQMMLILLKRRMDWRAPKGLRADMIAAGILRNQKLIGWFDQFYNET